MERGLVACCLCFVNKPDASFRREDLPDPLCNLFSRSSRNTKASVLLFLSFAVHVEGEETEGLLELTEGVDE